MGNKKINTSLVDKAIIFATNAHANTERRGKGFPYIIHPLEAASIVATITNDPEIIAAAILHDTVEDTDTTIEDIKKEFGEKVALLVKCESETPVLDKSEEDSWIERKQAAIDRIANSSYDAKIVSIGDKLSNMRAIYRDFLTIGDEIWNRFHTKDPREHEWHYRGLVEALRELSGTVAFKEFSSLVDRTFSKAGRRIFKCIVKEQNVYVSGEFNRENSLIFEKSLTVGDKYFVDFSDVISINFAGLRTLYRMQFNGIRFAIKNASHDVINKFYSTGLNACIEITPKFVPFSLDNAEEFGGGFTSTTFNLPDNDSMLKLYNEFVKLDAVQREKVAANAAMMMGVPTPFSGELLTVKDKNAISFERSMHKKSISRCLADDPENVEKYAEIFATMTKKLHSTLCTSPVFDHLNKRIEKEVNKAEFLSENDRRRVLDYFLSLPERNTCLHGDFHMGNVILTEEGDSLFIDMADFTKGDPLFDIGTLYTVCYTLSEHTTMDLYHINTDMMRKFFEHFIRKYLNTTDQKAIDDYLVEVKKFSALRQIFYANQTGLRPGMSETIKSNLLEKI